MIFAALLLGASLSATPATAPTRATSAGTGPISVTGRDPVHVFDASALRATLADRRERQLQRLHEYAMSGAFPRNTDMPGAFREYFLDPQGRRCAVANLLAVDGHLDWVREIAAHRNQVMVKDLHDARVDGWILGSGLLREELATIQKPAPGYPYSGGPQGDDVASRDRDELRARLLGVEADLRASTAASLDTAVARALIELQ